MDGLRKLLSQQLPQQFQFMYITRNQLIVLYNTSCRWSNRALKKLDYPHNSNQWRSPEAVVPTVVPKDSIHVHHPKSIVQAIPINRQPVKTIFRTIPTDRQSPKSFVWTIPINWKHQTSIVQAIPNNGQSLKSIVRTIPINTCLLYTSDAADE